MSHYRAIVEFVTSAIRFRVTCNVRHSRMLVTGIQAK